MRKYFLNTVRNLEIKYSQDNKYKHLGAVVVSCLVDLLGGGGNK